MLGVHFFSITGQAFMRLTNYTDYALRVLLYAGAAGETVTISRISASFDISKDHLRKVVHALSQAGYVTTTQGRSGGITLARPAHKINIRDVVESFETTVLVECFDAATNTCQIDGICGLKHALFKAQNNFLETLGNYTLSNFIEHPQLIAFSKA
jgi:Rrf2 family nitric oxide-sensitive transcriptional repressor